MVIEMVRGSTTEFGCTITRNPGLMERIFPSCYDGGLFILTPTEEIFRQRIKKAVKVALDFAEDRDSKDKIWDEKITDQFF
jgi:hypothetical protein